MKIFCPVCGAGMSEKDGILACFNSLELNRADSGKLIELVKMEPSDEVFAYPVGGRWYCPACGLACKENEPGLVQCPDCKRSLASIIKMTVERFKHA
jgi:uncharacterized Zn finger protein (UPF0148 family)